jgi:hypothetical protein
MYQISVRTYVCISGHGSVVIERWIEVLDIRVRPCMSKKADYRSRHNWYPSILWLCCSEGR